jgi:hypothetical protein
MKKNLLFCTLVFLSFSYLAAQQARPITDIIADTVTNYLSPFGGKGRPGEKLLVLHFKAPSAALNDWAIDRFTEIFKQHGAAPVERRNRPDFLDAAGLKNDIEFDDDAAAALGNRAGVRTVFTGAFSPKGGNWALDIRAVSAADKKVVWSKSYLIQPGDTFTRLAAQVTPAVPDPVTAIPAKTKDDLMTEAAQTAAVREYHEFVDKNFPNIVIDDSRISDSGGSRPFLVSYTWRHTDKIPLWKRK